MSAEQLLITPDQANKIFATPEACPPGVLQGETFVTPIGVELQFGAVTLGLEPAADGKLWVTGNTVPRLCDAAEGCNATACGLGRLAITNDERRSQNCAAANTVPAFQGRPGYVLTPLSPNVVFLADPDSHQAVTALDEAGRETEFFAKVRTASALVISEHDIPAAINEQGGIAGEMNVADSAGYVASFEFQGTRYAILGYSSRENFTTEVLADAIRATADRHGIEGDAMEAALQELKIRLDVGFSASLENFAHEVYVPAITLPPELEGANLAALTDAQQKLLDPKTQKDTMFAISLLLRHGFMDPETGEITGELTPTLVMDALYPEALPNGEIYGQYEVENGIDVPRGPNGCPGHGELCYIHYPRITQRILTAQLQRMGVHPDNIDYHDEHAVDPASPDNNLASNRLFQLVGVPVIKTPRTASGVRIAFLRAVTKG